MQSSENLLTSTISQHMKLVKSRTHLTDSTVSDVTPKNSGSADNPKKAAKQADMLYEKPSAAATQMADKFEPVEVKEGMIGGVTCMVVDARNLWKKMGVGRDFSTWIKGRLANYEFIEGNDFEIYSGLDSRRGGRPSSIYLLSLSVAKYLAMIERTPRAKQVRSHLIYCERRLADAMLEGAVAAVRMEQPSLAQSKVEVPTPKDSIRVADVTILCNIAQACKDRAWLLAMRQYGEVLLLSRDEKACQALAQAIQIRLLKQLERGTEKLMADIFTETGYAKAISTIEKWVPSSDDQIGRAGLKFMS